MRFSATSLLLSLLAINSVKAQAPTCGIGNFYEMGINNCIWTYSVSNTAVPNGFNPSLPIGALGLAIGPNFFAASPATTFYTVLNNNYYYYNGTTWINTGHSAGTSGFVNPGGSANYIYNINSSGQVSRYNGTGPATIIATYTNFTSGNVSQDIAGDANDNYYIVKISSPALVNCYNAASSLIASYPLSNLPGNAASSQGFSINKGYLALSPSMGFGAVMGQLSNNVIDFGAAFSLACGGALDMASCPNESYLVPAIRGVPSASLPCNGGTITLTSDDLNNSQTYIWSGPGIVGSTTSQSIVVNATGVYSRSMTTIAGVTDVSTFTVYQGNQLPLQVAASANAMCDYSAPITMTASGLGNYVWNPAASLSSATGSIVSASPNAITNYTVNGSLNGCVGSTVITIAAAPAIPTPSITVPNASICVGANGVLATNAGSLNIQWYPGSYTTNFIIVTPTVTSVYTLVISNSLGCSKTATAEIAVVNYPNLSALASQTKICAGDNVNIVMTGASTYTVLPGNLTGNSVNVNPQATTLYTITGANWNCSTTQQVLVDVMPLPQFSVTSSSNQICVGQSATITASGSGNTYTIMPGNLSGNAVVVSPIASQLYTLVASNQSCTANQTVALTVNPLPQIVVGTSKLELCVGESADLTAFGATTYTWSSGSTGSFLQVSPVTTTTYQVQGLSGAGCIGIGSIVQKVNACAGIENFASSGRVRFYPNPGNGQIEIDATAVPETARIEVRNYLGQVVLETKVVESVDISAFAKGVYVVSVLDNTATLYHVIYVLQ